jgi:hypothetical protein
VVEPGPDTKLVTTTSSREIVSASSAPPATPGMISGSVIRRKVWPQPAPLVRAASSSVEIEEVTSTLIWVAPAAMAPGTPKPSRRLTRGVSFGSWRTKAGHPGKNIAAFESVETCRPLQGGDQEEGEFPPTEARFLAAGVVEDSPAVSTEQLMHGVHSDRTAEDDTLRFIGGGPPVGEDSDGGQLVKRTDRRSGVGVVTMRNSGHLGPVGHFGHPMGAGGMAGVGEEHGGVHLSAELHHFGCIGCHHQLVEQAHLFDPAPHPLEQRAAQDRMQGLPRETTRFQSSGNDTENGPAHGRSPTGRNDGDVASFTPAR